MQRHDDNPLWRYAPLWAMVLGASSTLVKKALTAYMARRRIELDWTDAATAVAVAGLSYLSFRRSYGDKVEGRWYTR